MFFLEIIGSESLNNKQENYYFPVTPRLGVLFIISFNIGTCSPGITSSAKHEEQVEVCCKEHGQQTDRKKEKEKGKEKEKISKFFIPNLTDY